MVARNKKASHAIYMIYVIDDEFHLEGRRTPSLGAAYGPALNVSQQEEDSLQEWSLTMGLPSRLLPRCSRTLSSIQELNDHYHDYNGFLTWKELHGGEASLSRW